MLRTAVDRGRKVFNLFGTNAEKKQSALLLAGAGRMVKTVTTSPWSGKASQSPRPMADCSGVALYARF